MNPKIVFEADTKFPTDLSYWFVREDDRIRIVSNALKTPEIYVSPGKISVIGEWIYRSGNSVVTRDEEKEDIIDYPTTEAIDFVYVDGVVRSIERKNKNIIYNGEKYSAYTKKYAFSVLENKNVDIIFVNGKEIEVEKPVSFRIYPTYVNLVYNDKSVVIDLKGNKTTYNKPEFYLGVSSKGRLFQSLTGKITAERDSNLMGVCSSEVYYVGEASTGIVIVCDTKAKYYANNGWSFLGNTSNLLGDFANFNYVIITDSQATVFNGDFERLFSLNSIHSAFADRKYIYVITNSRKLYIIEPVENYAPMLMLQDSYGATITVEKTLYPSLKLGKGLVKVSETENGEKVTVRVEPTRLTQGAQSFIEISNDLFTYRKELNIPPAELNLDIEDAVILVSERGRVKGEADYYNALLKAKVKLKAPSKTNLNLKFRVHGKEKTQTITETEEEREFKVPLLKPDKNDEIVVISIERNGYTEVSKEFPVKIEEVQEKKKSRIVEQIENAKRMIITKSEDEDFEWLRVKEYQDPYDNVIVAKAGEIITIEEQQFGVKHQFEVKAGVQKVTVKREGYKRDFIVYGLENPVKDIKASVVGNSFTVDVALAYKVPVTIIYGTQIQTNTNGKFVFDLDPFYDSIIVKAFYSDKIKWEMEYKTNSLIKEAFKQATSIAENIKEKLVEYGLL